MYSCIKILLTKLIVYIQIHHGLLIRIRLKIIAFFFLLYILHPMNILNLKEHILSAHKITTFRI
jgi:hypothetical protein